MFLTVKTFNIVVFYLYRIKQSNAIYEYLIMVPVLWSYHIQLHALHFISVLYTLQQT